MSTQLGLGSKVAHPSFGEGVVVDYDMNAYTIYFHVERCAKEIDKSFAGLEVLEATEAAAPALDMDMLEQAIGKMFRKYVDQPQLVALGGKWMHGKLIIQPGSLDLQSKEMPIETFFHKIVMVRDRLRVLEQNINSHSKLDDEDKVHLQQYITRAYGSLTSFNVLFNNKEDQFKGSGK